MKSPLSEKPKRLELPARTLRRTVWFAQHPGLPEKAGPSILAMTPIRPEQFAAIYRTAEQRRRLKPRLVVGVDGHFMECQCSSRGDFAFIEYSPKYWGGAWNIS
jgi:hypothetical protein